MKAILLEPLTHYTQMTRLQHKITMILLPHNGLLKHPWASLHLWIPLLVPIRARVTNRVRWIGAMRMSFSFSFLKNKPLICTYFLFFIEAGSTLIWFYASSFWCIKCSHNASFIIFILVSFLFCPVSVIEKKKKWHVSLCKFKMYIIMVWFP